jgi:hypothetical protein
MYAVRIVVMTKPIIVDVFFRIIHQLHFCIIIITKDFIIFIFRFLSLAWFHPYNRNALTSVACRGNMDHVVG